jgi:hypothetical protein
MSFNHHSNYFRFLVAEYSRLVAEASLHRLQGNHGTTCCFTFISYQYCILAATRVEALSIVTLLSA